ncbi:MAG: hypothetical protein HY879_27920 [Deltaproteobacteria bacterium]|nr:hypothetical protein [Deltaproteobacteria bacterium]
MKTGVLYSDSLVVLTEDRILFEHYYFPIGGRKVVLLADIERITVEPPTLWNGKWRLHGTGNFKTWFPQDYKRPKRDRIFFATLRSQGVNIGFTVENGDQMEKILRDKNLIKIG